MSAQNTQQWFETSLGKYLLAQERNYFDQVVANIFGYNALQLGLHQFNFLDLNRMPLQFSIGSETGASLLATADFLPIETRCMDLVIMPHVLEFNTNPHQILREVHRILRPEGHIVISGFNPRSLWGACRTFKSKESAFPWQGKFIALPRLKDWLKLLDFEMKSGKLCCYTPPFKKDIWRQRFSFMEAAGDRWWPISGGVYFLQAVKRTHGMRIIKPEWKNSLARRKKIAPAAQRYNDDIVDKTSHTDTKSSYE